MQHECYAEKRKGVDTTALGSLTVKVQAHLYNYTYPNPGESYRSRSRMAKATVQPRFQ